jgi:hypothetical protein
VRSRASLGSTGLVSPLANNTDQQAHPQGGQQTHPMRGGVHEKTNIIRI